MLKKIGLISKSGFFASCLLNIGAMDNNNNNCKKSKSRFLASSLLNIGAMNNVSNLKEKCSKENTKDENNLKIENNCDNSFLLKDTIETCKKCNNIEKIKEDLTEILKSMEDIFLKVLNDCRYIKMKELAKELYFGKKEDDVFLKIDKFQMLLNLLDEDFQEIIKKNNKYKQLLYNIDIEIISEFKEQFKDDNKIDIVDYLVAAFKKLFTDTYKYETLGDGCFGLTYKSNEIKTLLVKELRKQPIGISTDKYNSEEELKKLKTDEYKNYLEKKDILPGYICQYYINLWSKIVILQMIPGGPYEDFYESKSSDKVENNIKKNIYINNCFNDLKNKIGYRLKDRHGNNMIICPHGYLYQIDIDSNSFSKDEGLSYFYFFYLQNLILYNKNGTSFSDLKDKDFDIYEKVSKYYKIYDVDFLHCIINNTYRKSPMFYLSNLINSLDLANQESNYNKIILLKILKFIDNVNSFKNKTKNKINNKKLFTLFSIVYNGKEENYNEEKLLFNLNQYNISQNNIDGTWKEDKTIKGFVNYLLHEKDYYFNLDKEYFKNLQGNLFAKIKECFIWFFYIKSIKQIFFKFGNFLLNEENLL